MRRSCLEIMGELGVQSHVPLRIRVNMSLPKAKDSLGSLKSQHKSVKNCSCNFNWQCRGQEIEEHFITPLSPAGGGRHNGQKRERTGSAQASNPSNLADPHFQVPAKKKKMQFQAQEREIHQYRYNWTSRLLPC